MESNLRWTYPRDGWQQDPLTEGRSRERGRRMGRRFTVRKRIDVDRYCNSKRYFIYTLPVRDSSPLADKVRTAKRSAAENIKKQLHIHIQKHI